MFGACRARANVRTPDVLQGRNPAGRGGGRASAALPLLDDVTTSPASRRLASARPALAPKCQLIFARTLSSAAFEAGCDSHSQLSKTIQFRYNKSIFLKSVYALNRLSTWR